MDKTKKRDERLPMWADSWTELAQRVPGIDELVRMRPDVPIRSRIRLIFKDYKGDEYGGVEEFEIDAVTLKARAFDEIVEALHGVTKKKFFSEWYALRSGQLNYAYNEDQSAILTLQEAVSPLLSE